jgi:ATP-dependent helicase HrpB
MAFSFHQWQSGRHLKNARLQAQARRLAALLGCKFELNEVREDQLALVLSLAFPDRIAQKRPGHNELFLLSSGHGAFLDSDEPLADATYLVVADLMKFSSGHVSGNSRILSAIALDIGALEAVFPEMIVYKEQVDWDERQGCLVAQAQWCCGRLMVRKERLPEPDAEKMTQALLNYVRRRGLKTLHWTAEASQWLERVRCAIDWLPEEDWPAMDDESLINEVEKWLLPFMTEVYSVKTLKQVSVLTALEARLGWTLARALDSWVPTLHRLPTGRLENIRYRQGHEPVLSVRIQEVFGEKTSPVIAKGKKRLVLELLSPARRPIQVTQDLAAFWQGAYCEVRKEMRGRYPKHVWPEDPANHMATTKTKRQLSS